jgi:methionyl-tRNA formyltransferase
LSARVGENNNPLNQLNRLKFFEQDLFNKVLSPSFCSTRVSKFKGFEGFQPYLASQLVEENSINSPTTIARIRQLTPDLIISIRYGCILKEECIKIPTKGVLNLHSGILPLYRGVMATFWAMLNGDSKIGTTLHTIDDASIDTGKIIKISTLQVQSNKSYLWHVLELYKQGVLDIVDTISSYAIDEQVVKSPQPKENAYFSFPTSEDLIAFEQQGLKLVDEQEFLSFISEYYL